MLRHLSEGHCKKKILGWHLAPTNMQLEQKYSPLRRRIHNSDHTARRPQRTRYLQDTLRRSPPFKKRNRHLCQRVGMADLAEGKGG